MLVNQIEWLYLKERYSSEELPSDGGWQVIAVAPKLGLFICSFVLAVLPEDTWEVAIPTPNGYIRALDMGVEKIAFVSYLQKGGEHDEIPCAI
jgi:hypothetical protein